MKGKNLMVLLLLIFSVNAYAVTFECTDDFAGVNFGSVSVEEGTSDEVINGWRVTYVNNSFYIQQNGGSHPFAWRLGPVPGNGTAVGQAKQHYPGNSWGDVRITVSGWVDHTPVISPTSYTVLAGEGFEIDLNDYDAPGPHTDLNEIEGEPIPPGVSFLTGSIIGNVDNVGVFRVNAHAANAYGEANETITVSVEPLTVTSPETASGTVGEAFSYELSANVPDEVTFGIIGGIPIGLSHPAAENVLYGTPTQAGEYNLTVTASRGNATAEKAVVITIAEASDDGSGSDGDDDDEEEEDDDDGFGDGSGGSTGGGGGFGDYNDEELTDELADLRQLYDTTGDSSYRDRIADVEDEIKTRIEDLIRDFQDADEEGQQAILEQLERFYESLGSSGGNSVAIADSDEDEEESDEDSDSEETDEDKDDDDWMEALGIGAGAIAAGILMSEPTRRIGPRMIPVPKEQPSEIGGEFKINTIRRVDGVRGF